MDEIEIVRRLAATGGKDAVAEKEAILEKLAAAGLIVRDGIEWRSTETGRALLERLKIKPQPIKRMRAKTHKPC